MKSIVFKITLAVSILVLLAILLETYFSTEMMGLLFYEYMSKAAALNDPYPILQGGKIITGPAEREFIQTISSRLLWIDVPVTILAFIISYLIAKSSTKTIRKLSYGVGEIARGNLDYKVDVKEGGEIGLLANSFNQMAGELARIQALRKRFFADATHELKTPIAVIKGNLEGMIDGVIPANKETFVSLLEETEYLGSMVGDMKYLALADSGNLKLVKHKVNINDIVMGCLNRLKPAADARNLSLTTDFKNDPLMALVDPNRIGQIVYNFLINAGKYTPENGSIGVRTEKLIEAGIEYFKVTVWDTGEGIAESDIPHLFERFYRVDKSRNRKTGGFGLGLSIVKTLTELHGGSVGVESQLGKGSSFYIVVPIGDER